MESTLPPDSTQHGFRPIVSICIANYNGVGMIDGCIESVRSQDCEFPFEIIVHDDASSDGSADHIRERHPDVLLIESPENVGFCVANNRMAAAASGEYLLLLNNDAELFPDALQSLHRESKYAGDRAILGLPQFDFDTGKLIDRGCMLDPFFNPVPNLVADRTEVAMVIGACLLIPKVTWEGLDGFPEWFDSIAEDMYLCCKARLLGYDVLVSATSGYRHRVGRSFGGGKPVGKRLNTTYRRRALSERNKSFVITVTCPSPVFQFLLPLHLVLLGVEGLVLLAIRRDGALWTEVYRPCFVALWRERLRLRRLRADTQGARRGRCTARRFFRVFDWRPYKLRMLFLHGLPKVSGSVRQE
jgi:GT2 family glycosyltransferase